jgi:hypothetical protein
LFVAAAAGGGDGGVASSFCDGVLIAVLLSGVRTQDSVFLLLSRR